LNETPLQSPVQRRKRSKGVVLKILLAFSILSAPLYYKQDIMDFVQTVKKVYTVFAHNQKDPGEGLSPRDVKPRRDVRNGVEFLIVEGNIINITKGSLDVPPLKVSLTNSQGKIITTQIIELRKKILSPTEKLSFKVEFEDPPGTARQMSVNFVAPEERDADGAR